MIALDHEPDAAWLVFSGKILRWSPAGYSDAKELPDEVVTVLTPASTVRVFEAGYAAEIHPSAPSAI